MEVTEAATKAEDGMAKLLRITNHHDKRDIPLRAAMEKSGFPWVSPKKIKTEVNTALKDAQSAEKIDHGLYSTAAKRSERAAHDIEKAEYGAQKKESELFQYDKALDNSVYAHTKDIDKMNTNSGAKWMKHDIHRMKVVGRDLDAMKQRQTFADAEAEQAQPVLKNVH